MRPMTDNYGFIKLQPMSHALESDDESHKWLLLFVKLSIDPVTHTLPHV